MEMNYSVVGFFDILGFASMVETDSQAADPVYLPTFIEVFEQLAREVHQDLAIRMFSDSIIVEASLSPSNFLAVLRTAASLQRRFLQRGILLRGGIAFGKHYADHHVTFSQGLVEAYRIESKIARFPRIVVAAAVLNYAWHNGTSTDAIRNEIRGLLVEDRDRGIFVDYLGNISLDQYAPAVTRCLNRTPSPSETVHEKMRWLLDYFNYHATLRKQPRLQHEALASGFRPLTNVA